MIKSEQSQPTRLAKNGSLRECGPLAEPSNIKVWGHRGCRGIGNPPENSLSAFKSAISQGADGVELDVFLTRDSRLVVFHDDTLQRMTDGHGDIRRFTLTELKQLRLKDKNGTLTDDSIPTLDEVLDVVEYFRGQKPDDRRLQDFIVNIEIKGTGIAKHVACAIKKRLDRAWKESNFQVSSFDMESLREMKRALPEIPRGALFASDKEPWDIREEQLAKRLAEIRDIQPETINITLPSLTSETTRLIGNEGARPVAWTCNERNPDQFVATQCKEVASRLLCNGVFSIITDYPGPMRKLVANYLQAKEPVSKAVQKALR
jgi:glycerophosphoryl diester phosphodiesterase